MKTKAILLLTALSGIVIAVLVWVFRKPAASAAKKTALSSLTSATSDSSTAGAYGIGGAIYIPSAGPIEFSNEFSSEFA
jgi:fructose-specific phosphotransferase system IIC component